MKKCRTPRCLRATQSSGRSPYCARCRYRRFAAANPIACAFNNIRKRARQRGHVFSLTREEFTKLVTESGWIEKRGKTAKSLSIDRIDSRLGYQTGNVRVLTLSQNSRLKYAPLPGWMKAEMEKAESCDSGVDEPF